MPLTGRRDRFTEARDPHEPAELIVLVPALRAQTLQDTREKDPDETGRAVRTLSVLAAVGGLETTRMGGLIIATGIDAGTLAECLRDLAAADLVEIRGRHHRRFVRSRKGDEALRVILGPQPEPPVDARQDPGGGPNGNPDGARRGER